MFSNLGMGEILMLVVVGLVIVGPERLPGAMNWFFTALRQVRDYATGATQQLKTDMGTDFDSIREPLQQIQNLRSMTPTAIVTKHLLGGDDSAIRAVKDQVQSTVDAVKISPNSSPNLVKKGANLPPDALAKVTEPTPIDVPPSPPSPPTTSPHPAGSAAKAQRPPFDPDST